MDERPLHPEEIKAKLRIEFGTVRAFEEQRALPADSVRDVLRGRSVKATAQAIADFLKRPINEVFPGRFVVQAHHKSRNRDAHRLNAAGR